MGSRDTKDRLLDAAARLFGAHGFEGTSLRSVTAEAGANLAAVHYHFGSKEALLHATFARRVEPINQERLRLLAKVEAGPPSEALPLEPILDAFLRPVLELGRSEGGDDLRQLAARVHTAPIEIVRPMIAEFFGEVVGRFVGALRRALPNLSLDELVLRLHFVIGVMIFAAKGPLLNMAERGMPVLDIEHEALLEATIAYVAAGLRAPSTKPSGRARRGRGGAS